MSRKQSRVASGLSPIQRKACIVLAACVLAVVISFVLAWILPQSLNLVGANDSYDPDLYPVDTSLEAVLKDASADDSYITSSLFVGDRTALALQKDGRITLDQYAGKEDLKISNFLKESCVAFEEDANTYTIQQAIAKMKARRVYVMIGSNDVDGSVTVDEFMNDYKQALQNIKNSYTYCDLIACAIPPVVKDSENAAQTQTLIDQFNQTVGKEQRINVQVTSVSNTNTIHELVLAAANWEPGASDLPDLFISYPKTVMALPDESILVDYQDYFSDEELSAFLPAFVEEGMVNDRLVMLPVAKSTEIMFINQTIFDRFSQATGVTIEDLDTWEGLYKAAEIYAEWTDGQTPDIPGDAKSMFVHDYYFNYFQVGVQSLGEDFF